MECANTFRHMQVALHGRRKRAAARCCGIRACLARPSLSAFHSMQTWEWARNATAPYSRAPSAGFHKQIRAYGAGRGKGVEKDGMEKASIVHPATACRRSVCTVHSQRRLRCPRVTTAAWRHAIPTLAGRMQRVRRAGQTTRVGWQAGQTRFSASKQHERCCCCRRRHAIICKLGPCSMSPPANEVQRASLWMHPYIRRHPIHKSIRPFLSFWALTTHHFHRQQYIHSCRCRRLLPPGLAWPPWDYFL